MTNVQQEIVNFTAKLAKAAQDVNDEYMKLSPEAKHAVESGVAAILNGFSLTNVLSLLSGQAQK